MTYYVSSGTLNSTNWVRERNKIDVSCREVNQWKRIYLNCRCKWSRGRFLGLNTPVVQDRPATLSPLRAHVYRASTAFLPVTKVRRRLIHWRETDCRLRVLPPASDCRWRSSRIHTAPWNVGRFPVSTLPRSPLPEKRYDKFDTIRYDRRLKTDGYSA